MKLPHLHSDLLVLLIAMLCYPDRALRLNDLRALKVSPSLLLSEKAMFVSTKIGRMKLDSKLALKLRGFSEFKSTIDLLIPSWMH
jgi:hypothetical protein